MSDERPSLFLHGAAADALRRPELERLKAATIPTLDALRGLMPDELKAEVAGMLDRLGYTHHATTAAGDLIMSKDGRKVVVACPKPGDPEPIRPQSIARLHDAMNQANAAAGFFVTSRGFEPEAVAYTTGLPITLVDGDKLVASMRQSKADTEPPDAYKAMCKICGCIVQQRLSRGESVPCGDGHFVAPTIARSAILPERGQPASSAGDKSPAPRARRGQRNTPKAYNKRMRARHARSMQPPRMK